MEQHTRGGRQNLLQRHSRGSECDSSCSCTFEDTREQRATWLVHSRHLEYLAQGCGGDEGLWIAEERER